jgi:tRNA threonylcarbamoyl adenosine modification protein (Sua5/YciO/YrdC/YwlC family)
MTSGSAAVYPPHRAIIFDMDGTLYQNRELDRLYQNCTLELISQRKGISLPAADRLFTQMRGRLRQQLQFQPSKLFTLTQLGISDRTWAATAGRIPVSKILKPQPRVRRMFQQLSERFRLGLVTNNHRANTLETLKALQLADVFDEVMTLSESRQFKPEPALYQTMANRLGVDPEDCLSVGDRYDLDLEPAARIGMQTLLVQRQQDLLSLSGLVSARLARHWPAKTPGQIKSAVQAASASLSAGRLAVLPTDTVYGLAAMPAADSIRWIYRAKGRAADQPLVLLLSDAAVAQQFAKVSGRAEALMKRFWPGALTLVLPVKPGTAWGKITRGQTTLGLRVPAHEVIRAVIRKCGGALATTSANVSGHPAPFSAKTIEERVLAFSHVVVDAGKTQDQVPSTIVQVTGNRLEILRQGKINI